MKYHKDEEVISRQLCTEDMFREATYMALNLSLYSQIKL